MTSPAMSGKQFQLADLSTPQQRRLVAANVLAVHDRTSPELQAAGKLWYPKVHDATAKGVRNRGMSVEQGAGVVAAVSPNMDWEKGNIDAFKELSGLHEHEWDTIRRSATGKSRSPEASDVLKGLSIFRAPDSNLLKAHRIMQGESVDTVLDRRTAPKTNSFAHNIADPGRSGPVTIDGRAHDIGVNAMRPWLANRGLNSAATVTGKRTRYEHFEDAYRDASSVVGALPHEMQAMTWVGAKHMEMSTPTRSGRPRAKGPSRVGQPYV